MMKILKEKKTVQISEFNIKLLSQRLSKFNTICKSTPNLSCESAGEISQKCFHRFKAVYELSSSHFYFTLN